jgi:hypothetical protein
MTVTNLKSEPKLYTISLAAKRLGINYQRMKYAIANRWVALAQVDPDMIEEQELLQFAKDRNISIPEK